MSTNTDTMRRAEALIEADRTLPPVVRAVAGNLLALDRAPAALDYLLGACDALAGVNDYRASEAARLRRELRDLLRKESTQ